MTETKADTVTDVAGARRQLLLPARAGCGDTGAHHTNNPFLASTTLGPGRPEPRAFPSVSAKRIGRAQRARGSSCVTRIAKPGPCRRRAPPVRERRRDHERERSGSCSWARCSFPPRQMRAPNRRVLPGACFPPAARARRRPAPRRGAPGQRLPADSEDTLTGHCPLRRPPGLGCRCQTPFAGRSSSRVCIKRNHSRWGAGAVRAAWHCLVPASKQRVVFV